VRAQREANSRGGKPAPELDGAVWLNTDKPKMSLAAFRGKYVLLQFWTTWCGPCHIDMPNVKLAHDLYKDKGMIVIGVHDNSTPIDGIKQDVAQQGLSYPIAVDGADGRILESYKALGVSGYPTYILIGPDGTIVEDPTGTARGLRMYMLEILRQKLMSPSSGIGAAVRIERGKVLVSSILPGSAAARTHSLQPNDRIIAVAEVSAEPVDVTGLDLVKVVGLIRGRNGTIVRLTMVPAGKDESDARVISLTRGEVKTSLGSLDNGKLLSPGAVAPNFRFTRMDGTEGDLSRLRGKVVVLEMWASWCKPCVQLVGKLQTLREEHPEWSGQVEILAVSVDEERGNAADCSEANQWNKIPPVWSGTSLCSAYHINGLPTTYIIDHDGRVVAADWSLDIPQTLRDKHLLVVENK
jgi:thiol-disulfide isomerase/thioredoxin